MRCYCPHQPRVRIVEPLQQLDGSALATPTGTHQGHRLPLADLQVQPLQDLGEGRREREVESEILCYHHQQKRHAYMNIGPGRVVKNDITELDMALQMVRDLPFIRGRIDDRFL